MSTYILVVAKKLRDDLPSAFVQLTNISIALIYSLIQQSVRGGPTLF